MPTQTPISNFTPYEADVRFRINKTLQDDELTGVPVLATEYRTTDEGTRELWLVYWQCDRLSFQKDQWSNVANAFVATAGTLSHDEPARLRVYSVSNMKEWGDHITFMKTSRAEKASNESISRAEHIEIWLKRMRKPSQNESAIAYQMTIEDSGEERAHRAFKEHYDLPKWENRGCPAGAEGVSEDS